MEKLEIEFIQLSTGEWLLVICIILISLAIFFFLVTTIYLRLRKKRRKTLRQRYAQHIERILFSIAFDQATMTDLRRDKDFNRRWKKKVYRNQFLEELIKLHRLYGGDIALKLQEFYRISGLLKLSYHKIRSGKWYLKCEGIQELSEMEIKKAAPIILEHTKSQNDTLKMVALIEVLHLQGLKGISLLQDYKEPINDWIQLNLLESIKEAQTSEVPEFGFLLKSSNQSLIIFGLRLVSLYHQNQYLPQVKDLQLSSSYQVRLQAERTLGKLLPTG